MSKPFDYSKWDNIELSDDEEDVHPNIDKESWFRMKHRSRVEREETEEKDKQRLRQEMAKANQRIQELQHDLKKNAQAVDPDDSDDEDLDDTEGIQAEIAELQAENAKRQAKLDEYERNKKWNVDNMCQVKEERTIINTGAVKDNYTSTGFAKSTVTTTPSLDKKDDDKKTSSKTTAVKETTAAAAVKDTKAAPATVAGPQVAAAAPPAVEETTAMYSYHEFTERYADLVEEFMKCRDFAASEEFLQKHGDVLLQENASNYLLLASLEDEMNGYREKMKQTARQSQIITNIAELAKSLNTHPGNVMHAFFRRMEQAEFLQGFMEGLDAFIDKIIKRAVTKKIEMDRQRAAELRESDNKQEAVDLESIPREERLGPGGLDPLEVIETLPESMQKAFESRDVDQLRQALLELDPEEAERHMKRCVDSGLWNAGPSD